MKNAAPGLVLAALAGLALSVAAPPHDRPIASFAFAPLLFAALRAGRLHAGRGFVLGLVAGAVFSLASMHWAVPVIERFGGLPRALAFGTGAALFLLEGLPPAIGCALAAGCADARRLHVTLPLALALAFSTVPVIFPWRPGHGAWAYRELVQLVDLGGLGLLDLTLGLVGVGVVASILDRRWAPAAIGALALGSALVYGHARFEAVAAARAAAPVLRVGVVQPDVRIEEGLDRRFDDARLVRLRAMTAELEREGADLVVWPEAAYPYELDRDARADRRGPGKALGEPVRGPLVFGAMTARSRCERWNSLVAMDEKGRIVDRADKSALFPFAEYVPLWGVLPLVRAAYPCPGLVPGRDEPLFELAGARIGILNCYEDVTDRHARALASREPEVLVGSASDAWYGDSAQPSLHRRVAGFRALELRRDFVRALNTGESSLTAATGEDLVVLPVFERRSFVAEARRLRGATVYAVLGDWVSLLAALALAGLASARASSGRACDDPPRRTR